MTIAKVQDLGTYSSGALASATSHTASALANAFSAGDFVAAWIVTGGTTTQNTLSDGLGNTYSKILQVVNSGGLALWVCYSATTGGTPTYTLTCSANFTFWGISASEWSGVASPVDQTASATGGASTSLSTGTTGATTTANELVLAGFGINDSSSTDTTSTPTGFSVLQAVHSTNSTTTIYIFPFSEIISSTGTQTASSTLSAAPVASFNLIATFPAATSSDPFPAGYPHPAGVVTTF